MKKTKRVKDIEPFEHLDFVVKNTTAYQRFKWLEMAWDFWHKIQDAKGITEFNKEKFNNI